MNEMIAQVVQMTDQEAKAFFESLSKPELDALLGSWFSGQGDYNAV